MHDDAPATEPIPAPWQEQALAVFGTDDPDEIESLLDADAGLDPAEDRVRRGIFFQALADSRSRRDAQQSG